VLRTVIRRLIGGRSARMWQLVARTCVLLSHTARDRRRWLGRAGFALMMAGDHARARTALSSAAGFSFEDDEFEKLVDRVAREGIPDEEPAAWYYNLGVCLRALGEPEPALVLIRAVCERHVEHARWLRQLAQLEEQVGDISRAVMVLEKLVSLRGEIDPGPRYDLASLYHRAGQWQVAQEILEGNIRRHANHAESHKLLADAVASIDLWGGSFINTLPARSSGRFHLGESQPGSDDAPVPNHSAVAALFRAVDLHPNRPQWQASLADAHLAAGDLEGAIGNYETALRIALASDDRWALGAKQRLQFNLEYCYYKLGKGRVTDPLFDVDINVTGAPVTGDLSVPGFYTTQVHYAGLTISGFLGPADSDFVTVRLNGALLRTVNVSRESYLPQFNILVKRTALAQFPKNATLEVRTSEGGRLLGPRGRSQIAIEVPHGNGTALEVFATGRTLNKKGEIDLTPDEVRRRQDRDLEIYARVNDFFQEQLGRPVFLLYGTLLGYYRDSDFISGDDDFDAGYVSDKSDPIAVKEEAKEFIIALIRAGFTVSFNRRGRLFRVQLERSEPDGCHVDIHSVWFQDERAWVHNVLSMPSTRDDFLPVSVGTLRGVSASIPRRPEAFLLANYGPGWRVPDPGFRYYPTAVEPAVRRNLARAMMTSAEYRTFAQRIDQEVGHSPGAGRFVSIGSQDLYPLEQFIA
jgi:tetratricopeptide (TPR) repeat protein